MSYPQTPVFKSVNFTDVVPSYGSMSDSGRDLNRGRAGQYFTFSAVYPSLTKQEFKPVFAFLMKQGGQIGRFTIVLPEHSYKSGDASGSVLAAGSAVIGASSVSADGLTGTLKAGDFIRFQNHSKVYAITADLTGAGALEFAPPLRVAVPDNTQLIYDAVDFTVKKMGDTQEYKLAQYDDYRFELSFKETY